jgi:hypothetical protein
MEKYEPSKHGKYCSICPRLIIKSFKIYLELSDLDNLFTIKVVGTIVFPGCFQRGSAASWLDQFFLESGFV